MAAEVLISRYEQFLINHSLRMLQPTEKLYDNRLRFQNATNV